MSGSIRSPEGRIPGLADDRVRERVAIDWRAPAFDRRLKVLHIRRSALVQNDKVDGKLLHPPIFVSLQDLSGDMEGFDLGDSQQHDRKIAGDA